MYARLKDYFGSVAELDLPEGATIEDVQQALVLKNPESGPFLVTCRFAINHEVVSEDQYAGQGITAGAGVDILPPSSGG